MAISRRTFIKTTTATTLALALGPRGWGWAVEASPFAELQDDPILKLPEGFEYTILAETGYPLQGGRGPASRPHFPDLNVVFPRPDGKMLLCTSHEIPAEAGFVGQPPPNEEYDHAATGAITSLLVNPDLSIAESAYNAGGMVNNCSGGKTPWGTVLTGEESTATLEADHGFVWEVDPNQHTKVRLDACGRFDHEAAVIDRRTKYVYLTEDSGTDSLLYRLRPNDPRNLSKGGVLQAYKPGGRWARIDDPLGREKEPSAQGIAKGALKFARLEGVKQRGRWMYFTETEDDTACGKIWRLHLDTHKLELWAEGRDDGKLCMPDNIAFDAAGNMFVCEDRGSASMENPNHVIFIDARTGRMTVFAEVVQGAPTSPGGEIPVADEPTGTHFSPDKRILFINLQRTNANGLTLAITGPFARPRSAAQPVQPSDALPAEIDYLRASGTKVHGMTEAEAAAWLRLSRLGRVDHLPQGLHDIAADLEPPARVTAPKRRSPKL